MSARKKKRKKSDNFDILIVLPLLLINIWAGWRIMSVAKALEIPLIGSVHNGPVQLAGLLLINCIVITLLTVVKGK